MNTPSNAELPFVSQRKVDDLLARMLRRQPEGESAEPARLKLLEEFDSIIGYLNTPKYKSMQGIREELTHVGDQLTEGLEFVTGLKLRQKIMAGDGSAIMNVDQATGEFEFAQIPQRWQMHGRIANVQVMAFNYDLTEIKSDTVPGGIRYVPFLELDKVFLIDEGTAQVVDPPEGYRSFMLPLDDETLDLRKSTVLHEPYKNNI